MPGVSIGLLPCSRGVLATLPVLGTVPGVSIGLPFCTRGVLATIFPQLHFRPNYRSQVCCSSSASVSPDWPRYPYGWGVRYAPRSSHSDNHWELVPGSASADRSHSHPGQTITGNLSLAQLRQIGHTLILGRQSLGTCPWLSFGSCTLILGGWFDWTFLAMHHTSVSQVFPLFTSYLPLTSGIGGAYVSCSDCTGAEPRYSQRWVTPAVLLHRGRTAFPSPLLFSQADLGPCFKTGQ